MMPRVLEKSDEAGADAVLRLEGKGCLAFAEDELWNVSTRGREARLDWPNYSALTARGSGHASTVPAQLVR